jgi:hypothetical protein
MVTHDEKERLLNEMRHEPGCAADVVYKCAAGLLILIGVALCGSHVDLQDATRPAGAKQASTQPHASARVVQSRKVFDERRRRFEASVLRRSEIAQR